MTTGDDNDCLLLLLILATKETPFELAGEKSIILDEILKNSHYSDIPPLDTTQTCRMGQFHWVGSRKCYVTPWTWAYMTIHKSARRQGQAVCE
jgi:hypothetical protein